MVSIFNKLSQKKNFRWYAFILIFLLSIIFSIYYNKTLYIYDSDYYWNTANPVFENGFNFFDFPDTYRGYFFTLLIGFFKAVFGNWGWRILISLMAAECFSFSLPFAITGRQIANFTSLLRSVAVYFFYMWIWGDFMQFPLSDFAAAFFIITSVALIRSIAAMKSFSKLFMIKSFLIGIFLYATYNTRAANLYGSSLILVVFIVINRKDMYKTMIFLLMSFLGILAIAIPQCLINQKYTGSFSPAVNTDYWRTLFYENDVDLQSQQVFWGLSLQRYETYAGDQTYYGESPVYFDDPTGMELINRYNISSDKFKIITVIELFLSYPLDMIALYVRHLISLMTPAFRYIYIFDLYPDRSILAVCSIIIWIIAGLEVMQQIIQKKLTIVSFYIFTICLAPLLQMFGAPEIRFFLPVYLLCYYQVFVVLDYKELILFYKGKYKYVILACISIFILWLVIYEDGLSNNHYIPLLIHDNIVGRGLIH